MEENFLFLMKLVERTTVIDLPLEDNGGKILVSEWKKFWKETNRQKMIWNILKNIKKKEGEKDFFSIQLEGGPVRRLDKGLIETLVKRLIELVEVLYCLLAVEGGAIWEKTLEFVKSMGEGIGGWLAINVLEWQNIRLLRFKVLDLINVMALRNELKAADPTVEEEFFDPKDNQSFWVCVILEEDVSELGECELELYLTFRRITNKEKDKNDKKEKDERENEINR